MTVLEGALRDTLQDVRRGDVASGLAMIQDLDSGLAVHGLNRAERRLLGRLHRELRERRPARTVARVHIP